MTTQPERQTRWWAQIAAVLLLMLELSWVLPWYRTIALVSTPPAAWKATLILSGVMAAAYALTLAIEELRLISQVKFIVLGGLLLVSLITANRVLLGRPALGSADGAVRLDPLFLITLLFVLWLWSRGIGLGNDIVRPMMAWKRFQGGLIALLIHTLLTNVLDLPSESIGSYVFYLFCGLLAVTLARIAYVSVSRSSRKNPFDRRWVLSISGILLAMLALAAMTGGLLTGQFGQTLDSLAGGLGYLFAIVIFIFSIPGLILVYLLGPVVVFLRDRLGPVPTAQSNEPLPVYPMQQIPETPPLPINVQMICFWMLVALVVLVVFLAARRMYQRRRLMITEGPESLLGQGEAARLARKAIADFFAGLGDRFRPAPPAAALARIRRIYIDLLELGASLRRPRPEGSTPLEYLPEMQAAIPESTADLDALTTAYLRVRYGELPEAQVNLMEAEAAWRRVSTAGVKARKALPPLPAAPPPDLQPPE